MPRSRALSVATLQVIAASPCGGAPYQSLAGTGIWFPPGSAADNWGIQRLPLTVE